MKLVKSIEKLLFFSVVATVITIAVTVTASWDSPYNNYIFAFLFITNVFMALLVFSVKKISPVFATIFITVLAYGVLAISFRAIRDFFPKPEGVGSEIVGFAQYFGYPLFFDLFLFSVLVILPIVIYTTINRINDK